MVCLIHTSCATQKHDPKHANGNAAQFNLISKITLHNKLYKKKPPRSCVVSHLMMQHVSVFPIQSVYCLYKETGQPLPPVVDNVCTDDSDLWLRINLEFRQSLSIYNNLQQNVSWCKIQWKCLKTGAVFLCCFHGAKLSSWLLTFWATFNTQSQTQEVKDLQHLGLFKHLPVYCL